jgi:redox-sensitive bicupin YhaK (pirin superfamily)
VTQLDQRVLLAPDDGSAGPLLRLVEDRLPPGGRYGPHAHRAVDVVAVVLSGGLRHEWADGADLVAGDVAVLRAGTGLDHDEVAGDAGAQVLQCYLRAAEPGAEPTHQVHRGATGWVDLSRPDARLWVARVPPGATVQVPPGLLVARDVDGVLLEQQAGRTVHEPGLALVWQLDTGRPAWADA